VTGTFEPMLATPWPRPFSDPGWWFEPKWDGMRALLHRGPSGPVLRSRRGNDLGGRFPAVAAADLPEPLVLDGEIVAFGDDGAPSFERLQGGVPGAGRAAVPVAYVVFDVLVLGEPVIDRPLEERRRLLGAIGLGPPLVVGEGVAGDGLALWEAVDERGLEGIVAKRFGSLYRPGARSRDWRKVVRVRSLRAVVGGYLPGAPGRPIGALALGLWDAGGLRWIGNVGSGFSDEDLRAIREALDEMARASPPFAGDGPAGAVWVEPVLVARVAYREWTAAGRIRHPRFEGFTGDPPEAATWSAEGPDRAAGAL
jgi:bifunctional non-homologous end joining protein LigD